ncbi:helix-turn-helix domain-containing protein [Actinosynnema sp. CA-299493]
MSQEDLPAGGDSLAARLAREIKTRRVAAGLSQPQLAKLIGYTRQYVSLAERHSHNLPSSELVNAIDEALAANGALTTLRRQAKHEQQMLRRSTVAAVHPISDQPLYQHIQPLHTRRSPGNAATHPASNVGSEPPDLASRPGGVRYAAALVQGLHRDYQAARYAEVAQVLPGVDDTVSALADSSTGDQRRRALSLQCQVAIVAAKLATKVGDGVAAYAAAERARTAAEHAEDPFGQAAAAYQLTCALLRLGGADEAELHAVGITDTMTGDDPDSVTWRGALTLISAVIAARRSDPAEAGRRLDHAEQLATRLGGDYNIGFTAFGPTNVRIHRAAVAVSVDDPHRVLAIAEQVDVTALPSGLHGRQGQFHLDSAWAHARLGEDPLAVIHLLESERVAAQLLRTHRIARTVVHDLLRRERRHAVPGLRVLARRIGVLA